jgi:hypothetical protein
MGAKNDAPREPRKYPPKPVIKAPNKGIIKINKYILIFFRKLNNYKK